MGWLGSPGHPIRMPPPDRFRYDGYTIDTADSAVVCRYVAGDQTFTERFGFESGGDWADPAVSAAVRILYLLAGVSYYKTSAASVIDLGELPTTAQERDFLHTFYVQRPGGVRLPQRSGPGRPAGGGTRRRQRRAGRVRPRPRAGP